PGETAKNSPATRLERRTLWRYVSHQDACSVSITANSVSGCGLPVDSVSRLELMSRVRPILKRSSSPLRSTYTYSTGSPPSTFIRALTALPGCSRRESLIRVPRSSANPREDEAGGGAADGEGERLLCPSNQGLADF